MNTVRRFPPCSCWCMLMCTLTFERLELRHQIIEWVAINAGIKRVTVIFKITYQPILVSVLVERARRACATAAPAAATHLILVAFVLHEAAPLSPVRRARHADCVRDLFVVLLPCLVDLSESSPADATSAERPTTETCPAAKAARPDAAAPTKAASSPAKATSRPAQATRGLGHQLLEGRGIVGTKLFQLLMQLHEV